MKVVFVSNYYNHHQAALSESLHALTGGQYAFIQTQPMETERKDMGWNDTQLPSFVQCSYQSKEAFSRCLQLVNEADVVLASGGSAVEKLIQRRIKSGKLLFRYSERVYKNARAEKQRLLRGIKYHLCNFPYKNAYLLCASAYAAADYAKTGNFVGKAYKWGYFPEVKRYADPDGLIANKEPNSILWVARMIDWKHPEVCLQVAKRLKQDGYRFRLSLIGNGYMEEQIRCQAQAEGLDDCVCFLGSMSPEQVRVHMEKASIFLFTSDFNEGWGAVLNESMNSCCAVVANHGIGAAPYLVQDGINGYLYQNGNMEDLYSKVRSLLDAPESAAVLGKKAYETLANTWNAETAAQRLLDLAQRILSGEKSPTPYEDGPCSKAEVLENNWYFFTEGK